MTFNPDFAPADFVPFRDRAEVARVNALPREAYLSHPTLDITILPDNQIAGRHTADIIGEIVRAKVEGRRLVMLMPNPNPGYRDLARLLNRIGMDCKHVWWFNMDEWADDEGRVAGPEYRQSFVASTYRFFWDELEPELRMPPEQFHYPTTENIGHYSDLMEEAGGIDVSYTGPGWAGHVAFVDPLTPEFSADLDEFLTQGARIVTLNPLTVAQNSLHGSFGSSGDIANVPPRAATIGPLDIARSRRRLETHALTTHGTFSSWQRTVSKLSLFGPVTPLVPTSIIQLLGAEVWVGESLVDPVAIDLETQY